MGERRFENSQTVNLQSVLSTSIAIHQLLADKEKEGEIRSNMVCGRKSSPSLSIYISSSLVL